MVLAFWRPRSIFRSGDEVFVSVIPENVTVTVDALVAVYRIGFPGMPRKAVLPTAAPDHDGAATAFRAVAAVELTFTTKPKVEPSLSVKLKLWPDADRARVSLYDEKSSQQ